MAAALAELKSKMEFDKNAEHPLTKRLRIREEIELLKVPIVEELTHDLLAKGFSVASFFNFRSAIESYCARMKTDCIIDGSANGLRYRDANLARFQTNESRLIALNIKAGRESLSLHDKHGGFPRAGLVMPADSAVDMRQVFGRLPRDGGKSPAHYKLILAAGTPDVKIQRAMETKHNNLDALNDGDFRPEEG
jgi:hypothetical protein